MRTEIVFGPSWLQVELPDDTRVLPTGLSARLEPRYDLDAAVREALESPVDGPPLRRRARAGMKVTIAFDDATVPCYAPLWGPALRAVLSELTAAGVDERDIELLCANSLHRKATIDELARLIGEDLVRAFAGRIGCHDAEDPDGLVHLGTTLTGLDVELNSRVVDSDLVVYLNCTTNRGFSGGWKSVCVGLSSYRSIHHHHTPDIMSMSLDRNRMHAMLDEMGALVESVLGPRRIFKLETVTAGPAAVHRVFGGSVGATRAAALEVLRAAEPSRRSLVDEPCDVVVMGVPDYSPYAAFSHGNPILDLISTGLGYLGGMIRAAGKPGCTVVLASPCPLRWHLRHHRPYPVVWEEVLPRTKDPDEAREVFEPRLAARADLVEAYRFDHSFHPVHAVMALYPLKRLHHAGRVVVVGAEDPAVPAHCGFDHAPTVEAALEAAREIHGGAMTVALVRNPPAFNRS